MVTTWNQSRQPPHKHDTRHAPTNLDYNTACVFLYILITSNSSQPSSLSLFFLSFSVSWFSPLPSFSYFLLSTPSARGASGLSLFINSSSSHLHFLFLLLFRACSLKRPAASASLHTKVSTLPCTGAARPRSPTDRPTIQFNAPSFSVSLRKTKLNNLPNSAC